MGNVRYSLDACTWVGLMKGISNCVKVFIMLCGQYVGVFTCCELRLEVWCGGIRLQFRTILINVCLVLRS